MLLTAHEQALCAVLKGLPRSFHNRYTTDAANHLIYTLFQFLSADSTHHLKLFFPNGYPSSPHLERLSLREAQGATSGTEYSEAARGHPCGHIFKEGEATYRCSTCSNDETCVLCARCYQASDHEGHNVFVTISPGNSGCCDCGDTEAWIREVPCTIHTATEASEPKGKEKEGCSLPPEVVTAIQSTIARALDYICDVFSCSPEQLRLPKTEESVRDDELQSRLPAKVYFTFEEDEEEDKEYALVLWNDEKHTVVDVKDQVSRACRMSGFQALKKAHEVDDIGRSIVMYSKDLPALLNAAKIIEQPKLTVTVRSARDTFREQMCATIIEWILDIAGCSVGSDHNILRTTICEEFLKGWRVGSEAHHREVGKDGLDDHEIEDEEDHWLQTHGRYPANGAARRTNAVQGSDDDEDYDDDDEDDDEDDDDYEDTGDDEMDLDVRSTGDPTYSEMDVDEFDTLGALGALENSEATMAGYPPPPPPPPHPRRRHLGSQAVDSDDADPATPIAVPKTPKTLTRKSRHPRPPKYWTDPPNLHRKQTDVPLAEDLWTRVRLDWFILFDLRMWKQLRTDVRDVFISTVVTLPHFKRLLGLRFAGVYTVLAELYLIADREPDHSIINLSLQMVTTPSITAEVVERGNFLSNLMAILYTFLTTRQVGYPRNVNLTSVLAFDQGAVTNRRTFHFYQDMKYLLLSDLVQEKIRSEDRYLLQFLDLAKLHQGICPNIRAIGEHVEFETDAWLSASLIIQEIIRLCRFVGECFTVRSEQDFIDLCRAIRDTAKTTIINCLGAERRRFDQSEIKKEIRFKSMPAFEFEQDLLSGFVRHRVVVYLVEKEPMSFHHSLHYTLSWLIDKGKSMSREQLIGLLLFSYEELRQPPSPARKHIKEYQPEDHLLALFDFPLRVLAWLAQMRAGMWVRNGITLRHQMGAYRGFPRRDLSYQRDIFMLQTAFVVLPPATVLASMIDRFDLADWVVGHYNLRAGEEEAQKIDVVEDFVHLLIILLSDRTHLLSSEGDPAIQMTTARRDIVHNLCFKPLTYSSLASHIPDKYADTEEFDDLVHEMTEFQPPKGVSDHGTFALKEQYQEDIDPYLSYFSRNQRDEAENIYRKYMAKKLGKDPAEVVYEPRLRPIESGLFKELANVTNTPLFAQVVLYLLQYTMVADRFAPSVPATKVEQYLQFLLHLILIAVKEDNVDDVSMAGDGFYSFCALALTKRAKHPLAGCDTIALLLRRISEMETFKSCEPKVRVILRYLRHKRPNEYVTWANTMDLPIERSATASPAPVEDKELRKQQALDRQARVMAQFKQQQTSFLKNQIDWGEDDFSDIEDEEFQTPQEEEEKTWSFPSGSCILCQAETGPDKLYGTFALINESRILRQTPAADPDWVAEAIRSPSSLDRCADHIRPFGVAGDNHRKIKKTARDGTVIELDRQELAKGFPQGSTKSGPVATGCGHIMHYACFEVYLQATHRRHQTQIARNHPEEVEMKEFLCPLCKALGNAFLPIIWKGKTINYPGVLQPECPFDEYLHSSVGIRVSKSGKEPVGDHTGKSQRSEKLFLDYGHQEMVSSITSKLQELTKPGVSFETPQPSTRQAVLNQLPMILNGGPDDGYLSSSLLARMTGEVGSSQLSPQILELVKIYQRLRDTMQVNTASSQFNYGKAQDELTSTDTLAQILGHSISAAEISQRGVESDPSCTLLDKISSQTITHLRVLSETISSYIAVGALRNGGKNATNKEFQDTQTQQLHQLFVGHPEVVAIEELWGKVDVSKSGQLRITTPLLIADPFVFLSECTACLIPALHLDVHHIMRLCYLAEMVKVLMVFLIPEESGVGSATFETLHNIVKPGSQPMESLPRLVQHVVRMVTGPYGPLKLKTMARHEDIPFSIYPALQQLIESYSLVFLRKCTILMHVRCGIEFPTTLAGVEESELSRLTRALGLPSPNDLISEVFAESTITQKIIAGWIVHWARVHDDRWPDKFQIQLSHPAIFELIGLPKNFDSLQDESMKRRCPTTGKDLTDPVVCLFCGEIFCSQGVCCKSETDKGGCWQHRFECGGTIGLFINIRKCMVVFLNGENGSWTHAPYLDKHGETDATLRRHHQLFLNQKRYDKLYRDVWLQHGVPSMIARRLEGDTNNGGWETL